jgi:integrase
MSSGGHIQRRGKSSWRLKYDLGRDPKTGVRIIKYKTVRGKKSEAQAELRRLLGTVDVGRHVDPGKMTVGDWLKQWLEEARHTTSPKTHERYSEIVNLHLHPALGAIQLAKFAPVHIQGFYSDALKSGRLDGKGGLSPQTVLHFHRLLDHAMKRARKLRLIAVNPVEDVDPPKVEEREMQTLDDEQAGRLLAAASTTRLYAPLVVALATGLRRGELLALRWQDINLTTGIVTVVRSLEQTKAGLRFKPTKTKRGKRPIVLPASVLAVLLDHKARQADERLMLGQGKSELVFTRVEGDPIKPDSFTSWVARVAERAGTSHIMPVHGLRHTHITNLLRENVHPKVASERAGHSRVGFTLDRYSHVIPSLQEDAAIRIDARLSKVLGS